MRTCKPKNPRKKTNLKGKHVCSFLATSSNHLPPLVPLDCYEKWITINFPPSETREYILEKMRRKNERVFRAKFEEADSGLRFYFYFQNTQTHGESGSRSFEVRRDAESSFSTDTFDSTSHLGTAPIESLLNELIFIVFVFFPRHVILQIIQTLRTTRKKNQRNKDVVQVIPKRSNIICNYYLNFISETIEQVSDHHRQFRDFMKKNYKKIYGSGINIPRLSDTRWY